MTMVRDGPACAPSSRARAVLSGAVPGCIAWLYTVARSNAPPADLVQGDFGREERVVKLSRSKSKGPVALEGQHATKTLISGGFCIGLALKMQGRRGCGCAATGVERGCARRL